MGVLGRYCSELLPEQHDASERAGRLDTHYASLLLLRTSADGVLCRMASALKGSWAGICKEGNPH